MIDTIPNTATPQTPKIIGNVYEYIISFLMNKSASCFVELEIVDEFIKGDVVL